MSLILETAAQLLDDAGLEGFNTNALAERAGVRVRTVYRYFPNKMAVIIAMAERMTDEWDGWFDSFSALSDPRRDLRELWSMYIDAFVDGIRRIPGGLAIRRAMRAIPELQAIDRADNERLAAQLAGALARRGDRLPRRRLHTMARVLIETAVTLLDSALLESPAGSRALVRELKTIHLAYLDATFTAAATRGSSHGS